ncbi:unnamed protein product [Plutella xylostella]|uniref:(diamondback moth) hypothetical protein n=1 Tax=Plutella xylostella TaxID=51655 RepID=A0A8S4E2W9_PLUXY|nr:unnamed protein product [Plutella xylostella]
MSVVCRQQFRDGYLKVCNRKLMVMDFSYAPQRSVLCFHHPATTRQGGERGNQSPCVQSPTSHPPAAPLNSRSNNFRISNATVIGTVTCDAGINT